MSHELMITSAPRGILPGSMGFCTVAMTPQVPSALVQRIESLSGYRHIFPPLDPRAKQNPICFQHLRIQVAGKQYSLLSRICDAGMDYSERSNKFAHHIALQTSERLADGPAAIMLNSRSFQSGWTGEPREIDANRKLISLSMEPGIARYWKQITGDGGWAGYLAEHYLSKPQDPVYLEYALGTDVLKLIAEASILLPEDRRWEVTFSTYYQGLPPDVTCHWRGVLVDSPEAKQARSRKANIVSIHPGSIAPVGGHLAEWSRTGNLPEKTIQITPLTEEPQPIELLPLGRSRRADLPTVPRQTPETRPFTTSNENKDDHHKLRLLPNLLGFLIGLLLAGATGFAIWFATQGDKGLEVAEAERRSNKEKELTQQLEESRKVADGLRKDREQLVSNFEASDKNNKSLTEDYEKLKKAKEASDKTQRSLSESFEKLKKEKDDTELKIKEFTTNLENAMNELAAIRVVHHRPLAKYSNLPLKGKPVIINNNTYKLAKLFKPHDFMPEWEVKHENNGFIISKKSNAVGQKVLNHCELSIDKSKAVISTSVDDKLFIIELHNFLKATLIELEKEDGTCDYLTFIKPEIEKSHRVIELKNPLIYYNIQDKGYIPVVNTQIHIMFDKDKNGEVRRKRVYDTVRMLTDECRNTKLHVAVEYSDNFIYYDNIVFGYPDIDHKIKSCSIKCFMYSIYYGPRVNEEKRNPNVPNKTIDIIDRERSLCNKLDNITLFSTFNYDGMKNAVDVKLWEMIESKDIKEVQRDNKANNPLRLLDLTK